MTINESLSAKPGAFDLPDLAKAVRQFPVRDGEKPWTAREVRAIADELIGHVHRLESELESADADLSELLRNSGDGAGDDQADSGSSALEREQELTALVERRTGDHVPTYSEALAPQKPSPRARAPRAGA